MIASVSWGTLLLFGLVTSLLPMVENYVPSVEWVSSSRSLAIFMAAFTSLSATIVVFFGLRQKGDDSSPLSFLLMLMFGAWMSWNAGLSLVWVGLPLIESTYAGRTVVHLHTIESAEGFSDRKCPNKITLKGMPLLWGNICSFSGDFRSSLTPNSQILVRGFGTDKGLFVESAIEP